MAGAFKTSEDVVKAFNEAGEHCDHDGSWHSLKRSVDFLGPFKGWSESDYETYDRTVKQMEIYLAKRGLTP